MLAYHALQCWATTFQSYLASPAKVVDVCNNSRIKDSLAVQVFLFIIKGIGNRALVHWIVDVYPEVSIKQAEQSHHENIIDGALQYTIRSGSQRVTSQLKMALRSGSYKEELVRFFLKDEYIQHTVLCISQQVLSASS